MATITCEDAIEMVRAVAALHDNIGSFLSTCSNSPMLGSVAQKELSSFPDPGLLNAAYDQGSLLIEVAADHLSAFVKTATEPVQTIAPWTCVRALLEACALSTWLLDPALDTRSRVAKSLAFRYEGLGQQRKLAEVAGDTVAVRRVEQQIESLERRAASVGFAAIRDKKGRRVGIGLPMPNITCVVEQAISEEVTYRLLSASVHAHPWALTQISFRRVGQTHDVGSCGDGKPADRYPIEKDLSPESVALLCLTVARSLEKPVVCKCRLFGWDAARAKHVFAGALASLVHADIFHQTGKQASSRGD